MLTKDQYDVLLYIASNPDASYYQIIQQNPNSKLILIYLDKISYIYIPKSYQNIDWPEYTDKPIKFLQPGYEAMAEYESAIKSENREDETLKTMKCELQLHQKEIKRNTIWNAVNSVLAVASLAVSIFSLFKG